MGLDHEHVLRRGIARQVARNNIGEGAEAINDIDLDKLVSGLSFGDSSEYRVDKLRENAMHLEDEEREKTVVAVAEDRQERHETAQIVAGAEHEGL